MNPLSEADADAIYDVLVEHAGAWPKGRQNFIYVQAGEVCVEYRFQGVLGLGGMFRRDRMWIGPDCTERWVVDCYSEDETPDRLAAIDACNQALAELIKEKTR